MCLTPPSDTGSGASSVTRERNSCNKGTAAAEFGWSLYSVCLANEFATETKLRYRKKSKHGEAVQNTSIGRPALLPSEHVDRLECEAKPFGAPATLFFEVLPRCIEIQTTQRRVFLACCALWRRAATHPQLEEVTESRHGKSVCAFRLAPVQDRYLIKEVG